MKVEKLKNLGSFYGGLTGKTKEDFEEGNAKFVSYMDVYSNQTLKADINSCVKVGANEKQNKIEYGDILFTGSSETPEECGMSCAVTNEIKDDLYLNSFCFGFRFNNLDEIDPGFYAHYFRSNNARKSIAKTANGVTRFNVSKKLFGEISIPLPSLTKQREIVTTLDSCTSLIAGLRQELTLRKKQYEYYREKMLSVEGEWKRLGEIGTINSGKCKERCEDGKYPLYGSTGEIARTNSCPNEGFRILIARVGANAGFVYRVDGKYDVSDNTLIFKNNDSVNANYIFYYLQYLNLNQFAKGGGQPLVTAGDLKNLEIPVPPLSVQQSIVERLDAFEGLISALSREVELREKQYEHLRERLLSFG